MEENNPVQTTETSHPTNTPPIQAENKPKSSRKTLVILGIIAVLFIAGISGAYFFGKSSNKETVPTPTSSPAPTDQVGNPNLDPGESKTNETANWKTYTIAGQYEFKYPIDNYSITSANQIDFIWPGEIIVKPNDGYLAKKPKDDSGFFIYAKENKDNLTINDTSKLFGSSEVSPTKVSVGGLEGLRDDHVAGQAGDQTYIYLIKKGDSTYKNGLIYVIILDGGENGLTKDSNAEKILSTVKFTQ